ncbi:MAG: hypothetical protein GF350_13830 [Chitinivibrionales bacterium]|nr:hypothetical protein [Chitinivibrionales bacterium]
MRSIDFSQKAFSFADILEQPRSPGVYAFKERGGGFLYIGKAKNLRQRLTGYFVNSEESPGKLRRLREEAHSFAAYICGSELEAMIYEYRLIRKHAPVLNKQRTVGERSGTYRPIEDCIILLPHADATKGLSFWFKKDQKIKLREFSADLHDISSLSEELESFFFKDRLPASPEDFPEIEIATRWVKRNESRLVAVPVSEAGSSDELISIFMHYWRDFRESVEGGRTGF